MISRIGCYISAENLLSRLAFSTRSNIYMKRMLIPEAYYNKTSLDGHFATAGKQMRASVVANKGKVDAFDAGSMFAARTSDKAMGTGKVNYVVHFEPNRDRMGALKINALPGLKKLAERIPSWIPNTRENRVMLARQREEHRIKQLTVKELKVCECCARVLCVRECCARPFVGYFDR